MPGSAEKDALAGWSFFEPPSDDCLIRARDRLVGATVGIVGLGLMGGSLGMALRGLGTSGRAARQVLGWTRSPAGAQEALRRGCVDRLSPSLRELCVESDIVVLAAPVRAILEQLPLVADLSRPGTLLLDLGSTKSRIVEVMSSLPATVATLGGHPMCGKDKGGPGAADANLYEGKVFVLSPTAGSTPAAQALAWALAAAVGARPLPLQAARHDRLVALISHLPYLAAAALVATAEQQAGGDGLVWELAASGFRDTTRVAGSEIDVMLDILLTNTEVIAAGLAALRATLSELQALLDAGDQEALRERLAAAQLRRRRLFSP